MDQLKIFWKYVVQYHFWILTSIVLITSLIVFSMSRDQLDQQVSSRYGALDGAFNNVQRLESAAPTHPNSGVEAEMNKILEAARVNVYDAWTKQYERQIPILKWSADIFEQDSEAVKIVDRRPIELFLDHPPPPDQGPLLKGAREVYRDYVRKEFTELAKIVGAQWTSAMGTRAAAAEEVVTTATSATTKAPLVIWSQASQTALQSAMAPWYDETKVPSTLEICYTQEDIWLLSAILKVIQTVNGPAKENFQAPIKEILSIKMGKQASEGSAFATVTSAVSGDTSGFSEGTITAATIPDPADNRYVDANLRPVSGADLRMKMKSTAPDDAFFAVAKRVPVRLRVRMDQSKLAKLLAELGNGLMMIEVKQVRVNSSDQPLAINLSAVASPEGGEGGEGGGFSGGFGGARSLGGESSGSSVAADPDTPVEVFGIVYLFNPPNKEKLGFAAEPPPVQPGGTL